MKIMKNKINYLIVKDKNKKETIYFECNQIKGYELVKNNKKVINGVDVNKMMIVKDTFIEKVINKKVDKKMKSLLELIASVCESDEDPGSAMMFCLNEVEKFKRYIINQYASYMNKKQIEMLDKKVKMIENEVKMRLYQYSQRFEEKEEVSEKTGHRRR